MKNIKRAVCILPLLLVGANIAVGLGVLPDKVITENNAKNHRKQ